MSSCEVRRYDVVFSLGGSCQVAYQLKRRGLRTKSGPFDWFTVRMDALLRILENDFRDFMLFENLVVEQNREGRLAVRDRLSTVLSLHDFHGAPDDPNSPICDYDEFRAKVDRRVAAFRKDVASSPSMLFVRSGGTREQALELLTLLESMRAGRKTALIVVGDTDEMAEEWRRPNLYSVRIRFPKGKGQWRGIDAEWDKALDDVRLTHTSLRQLRDRFDCIPIVEKVRKHLHLFRNRHTSSGSAGPI